MPTMTMASTPVMTPLPPNLVVCLMAPTASGKTALAYELYDTGQFEIISVDSALIYKDMNIGTAKPTPNELARYPHHLVDIIEPTETYGVASFVADVERLIADIHQRGKTPLLVGGTMMYYMALFTGLSPVPETHSQIRAEVESWRQEVGIEGLYNYLKDIDPIIANKFKPADTQRITRAIEVYKQTGKPLSDWQQLPKVALADNPQQFWLGLAVMPNRPWLHQRIEQRLEIMWESGFFEEVLALIQKYAVTLDMPAMRCVGYRQVIEYLLQTQNPIATKRAVKNESPTQHRDIKPIDIKGDGCQDMKNKALYATRQLAKRQYTWMRSLLAHHSSLKETPLTDLIKKTVVCDGPFENVSEYSGKIIVGFSTMEAAKQYLLSYFE